MVEDLLELEGAVRKLLDGRESIKILEAGCGSMSHIQFPQKQYLVGMDISADQLERNTQLDEKIQQDIQAEGFPVADFDVVVCWDVLEHLPHPERALANFCSTVKEGGIILLASPNVMTTRGLIAKFTPHWFHVLFYRYVYGHKTAGRDGYWPFKSYHRFSMSPNAIVAFARRNGLSVAFFKTYEIENPERKHKAFDVVWRGANVLVHLLTFGIIGTDRSESFMIVLKKPDHQRAEDGIRRN